MASTLENFWRRSRRSRTPQQLRRDWSRRNRFITRNRAYQRIVEFLTDDIQDILNRQYRQVRQSIQSVLSKSATSDVQRALAVLEGGDVGLFGALEPNLLRASEVGVQLAQTDLGGIVIGSQDVWDTIRVNVAQVGRQVASQINDGTRSLLQRSLVAGVTAGETMEQLTDRVARATGYQSSNRWRAARIARTEVPPAINSATIEGYRESGVVQGKEWLAGFDARPAHAAASGQVVPLGEPFIVGGEKAMFPGDPNLSPGNRINCRCGVLPHITREPVVPVAVEPLPAWRESATGHKKYDKVMTSIEPPEDLKRVMLKTSVPKVSRARDGLNRYFIKHPEIVLANDALYGDVLHEQGHHIWHTQASWWQRRKFRQAVVRESTAVAVRGTASGVLSKRLNDLEVNDLFGAVTLNEVGYGHTRMYLRNEDNRENEAFANMVSIYSRGATKPRWKLVEREMPGLAAAFKVVLGKV